MGDRASHWDRIYGTKSLTELSWHQDDPAVSLELSELAGVTESSSVIDIGGGTSCYAARLIEQGVQDVTVLDVSSGALDAAQRGFGWIANKIHWIATDITRWTPLRQYDLWHDRAVFHFLTEPEDRAA